MDGQSTYNFEYAYHTHYPRPYEGNIPGVHTKSNDQESRRSSRSGTSVPPTRSGLATATSTSSGEGVTSSKGVGSTPGSAAAAGRKCTQAEIDRETLVLAKTEKQLQLLKKMAEEKGVVLDKLLKELQRMATVLNKAKEVKGEVGEKAKTTDEKTQVRGILREDTLG